MCGEPLSWLRAGRYTRLPAGCDVDVLVVVAVVVTLPATVVVVVVVRVVVTVVGILNVPAIRPCRRLYPSTHGTHGGPRLRPSGVHCTVHGCLAPRTESAAGE